MRLLGWILLLIGIGCLTQSQAFWQSRNSNYDRSTSSGSYQGPGDIVSGAAAFWSCGRAYTAAFAATQGAICIVKDTATGLTSCTLNIGTNGFANLSANVCAGNTTSVLTFCTITNVSCSISQMYDQTGNGVTLTQNTLANMPTLSFNVSNSLPCPSNLTGGGSFSEVLNGGSAGFPTTTYAITVVGGVYGNLASQQSFFGFANPFSIRTTGVAGEWRANFGTQNLIEGISSSALHAVVASTAPVFAIDGTSNTNANGSNSIQSATLQMMLNGGGGAPLLDGYVCEVGVWPNDMSGTYASMITNMRSPASGWNF